MSALQSNSTDIYRAPGVLWTQCLLLDIDRGRRPSRQVPRYPPHARKYLPTWPQPLRRAESATYSTSRPDPCLFGNMPPFPALHHWVQYPVGAPGARKMSNSTRGISSPCTLGRVAGRGLSRDHSSGAVGRVSPGSPVPPWVT